jgi:exopolysaccharide production protein ExoQ
MNVYQSAFIPGKPWRRGFSERGAITLPRREVYAFIYSFLVGLLCLANGVLNAISTFSLFLLGLVGLVVFRQEMLSNPKIRIAIIFPLLAFASTLWSIYPATTLYYSVQLFLTFVVAMSLASFTRLGPSLQGLFYAHLVFALISFPLGQYALWEDGNYVFVGLSVGKNNYGGMNAWLVILSVYALHTSIASGRRSGITFGFLGLAAGILGVVMARSTGSLISIVVTIGLYAVLVLLSLLKRESRIMLLILFGSMGIVTCLIVASMWQEISSAVLQYFGKSTDLTGRTDLWFIADRLIERNYWLGVGQYAFWVPGNPAAESIWAEYLITGKRGFNFHNTYREIMVHLGAVGVTVYFIAFAWLFLVQAWQAISKPQREQLVYFVALVSALKSLPVESMMPFVPANTSAILVLAALTVHQRRLKH